MEKLIKRLLWLYFFLLVGEGVLRKWILPGLSEPLLIIRDPVALAIYVLAFIGGRFPFRVSLLFVGVMALCSILFATFSESHPLVSLYGLRINYFHLPLIFIMADLLDREDVINYGRVVLWLTVPIGLLMLIQFQAGERSWLNAGAGGDIGSQLRGALGKARPPGPFAFITGPALWFPLATAFTFYGWINRRVYPQWLLILATCTIFLVIPISVSRMLMFSVLVVVAFGGLSLLRKPQRALTLFIPGILIAITYSVISGGDLTAAFQNRWEHSTSAGVQHSIVDRFFNEHLGGLEKISRAPLFGHGIGMGSNVGSRFTTGEMGFQLAESEWAKSILELGPFLGVAFILYRCWLSGLLLFSAWRALFSGKDSLSWLICGACVLPAVSGQWAPPTILGFAVVGSGLALAATKFADEDEYEYIEDETEFIDEEDPDIMPESHPSRD